MRNFYIVWVLQCQFHRLDVDVELLRQNIISNYLWLLLYLVYSMNKDSIVVHDMMERYEF